ncbi:hypothetical protein RUM44_008912 [Polyplax serrata]|uniref:C2H2-type domain-containing protein n=1 Tax=Polyplax serrata TaxID=468196 RepID=A0ABR1AR93_POLSC
MRRNQAGTRSFNAHRNTSGASLTDPGSIDLLEGSKQWQIKYAFEKVEGSGFKCKICGQIKKHVRNHYLKHFPEHHECPVCRRTYTRKDNLNSHLKRDHFQSVKTPPDPYNRLKRFSKKFEDYQGLKCLTPDIFSQIKYSTGMAPGSILSRHTSSLQGESSPLAGPMDLSLRPSSVPVENQCTPIYDILPSFYNYFRT